MITCERNHQTISHKLSMITIKKLAMLKILKQLIR